MSLIRDPAMTPDIILGCGSQKRKQPSQAWCLYNGALYTSAYTWARSVTPLERIYILSGKYGLIRAQTRIAPYNARMGTPAQVCTVQSVARQAAALGLDRVRPLLMNTSQAYRDVLTLPRFDVLVDYMDLSCRDMVHQRRWFKRNHGHLPRGLFDDASQ